MYNGPLNRYPISNKWKLIKTGAEGGAGENKGEDASVPGDQTHGREHPYLKGEWQGWHESQVYETATRVPEKE